MPKNVYYFWKPFQPLIFRVLFYYLFRFLSESYLSAIFNFFFFLNEKSFKKNAHLSTQKILGMFPNTRHFFGLSIGIISINRSIRIYKMFVIHTCEAKAILMGAGFILESFVIILIPFFCSLVFASVFFNPIFILMPCLACGFVARLMENVFFSCGSP